MPTLISQIRQVIKEELKPVSNRIDSLDSKLGRIEKTVTKNHKEALTLFNDLDRNMFYANQRLTNIESELKITPPKFSSRKRIKQVLINPR